MYESELEVLVSRFSFIIEQDVFSFDSEFLNLLKPKVTDFLPDLDEPTTQKPTFDSGPFVRLDYRVGRVSHPSSFLDHSGLGTDTGDHKHNVVLSEKKTEG